jgi:chromosomal replication initiation ATPase DnaA
VAAGSDFAAEWIEDKYGDLLTEVAERVFGRSITLSFQHQAREGGAAAWRADFAPAADAQRAGGGGTRRIRPQAAHARRCAGFACDRWTAPPAPAAWCSARR